MYLQFDTFDFVKIVWSRPGVDEYKYFLEKYKNLMLDSTGKQIVFEEKYEDPPFNRIVIKSNIKTFKKGSLLKWIEKFS